MGYSAYFFECLEPVPRPWARVLLSWALVLESWEQVHGHREPGTGSLHQLQTVPNAHEESSHHPSR